MSHKLLEAVLKKQELPSDAALARLLQVSPSQISNVRAGRLKVGPTLMLAIHEVTDMPIARIRELAAEKQ